MVTLDQIKVAHSKVKSGADFPAYIQELKKLGIFYYETFVSDGHTLYVTVDGAHLLSPAKYDALLIAEISNKEQFRLALKAHQQGKTDYPSFCADCAMSGIEKWLVDMHRMKCTYFNSLGDEVLEEVIPG